MTTITDTQMNKAEQAAQKAEAEARAAAEKLAQLRAEQAAAEEQAHAEHIAKRARFIEQRRKDYPRNYGRAVREAREAFNTTAREGGDVFKAWADYMRAIGRATREENMITRWQYDRDKAAYDDATTTVRTAMDTINRATQHATRNGDTLAPHPDDTDAVADANRALNTLLADDGKPARELTDLSYFTVTMLDIKKPISLPGRDKDTHEKRTMLQALNDVHAQIVKDAQQEHGKQIAADLEAFNG